MPVRFSEEQLIQATGARKLQASARSSFEEISTDTRKIGNGALFVALKGERFDAHTFLAQAAVAGAAAAVVAKGAAIPETPPGFGLFEVDDTLHALGAIARFHRHRFQLPLCAVGGSNGKTTTKEMVGAILATRGPALKTEGNFNNEIGVPLTLFRLGPEHVAAVIEMGMNHAGEMSRLVAMADPDAALLTVVQPEHLEGLGSLEGVAAAEGELFFGLRPGATAVVNLDDPLIVDQARRSGAKQLTFGTAASAQVRLIRHAPSGMSGQRITVAFEGREHEVALNFVGGHNAHNATAAFALALALGYTPDECVRGLADAKPYSRRLNVVPAPGGLTVLDDCYNANPASMDAALETVEGLSKAATGADGKPGRAVAILGDMLELGPGEADEHRTLGTRASGQVALAAFFGPRSKDGFEAAKAAGLTAAHFLEVEPLMAWLRPQLRAGDVVLVKASRGMRLERAVEALTGQAAGGSH